MIEARGLTKRFDEVLAVDGLSLEVQRGEVFGLLGPNGAGKTTTLRMLCALIEPTGGEATINGLRLGQDNDAIRGSIGILTETPGIYPRLSARHNLELFADLYEVPDPAGQVKKYLELLDLWDRCDDPAGGFSKGMRQRLAIARALMHEPPILFLDEPTSALDPASARIVREFIEDLRGQGRTIILCTHNMDEADRLCDRVAVFRKKILEVDDPDVLRRRFYGESVRIRLRRVDETICQAITELPFVDKIDQRSDDSITINLDDLASHNPDIVRCLVAAGADVLFVEELKQSMEQLYMDILAAADTRGEPQEQQP